MCSMIPFSQTSPISPTRLGLLRMSRSLLSKVFRQAAKISVGPAKLLVIPALAQEVMDVHVASSKSASCVDIVNAAALQAMNRLGQVEQMSVYGDPVPLGPRHLRVDVHVFDVLYAVDINIDQKCRVLSVSTDRESNPPP
jgi:hypothetical protein